MQKIEPNISENGQKQHKNGQKKAIKVIESPKLCISRNLLVTNIP